MNLWHGLVAVALLLALDEVKAAGAEASAWVRAHMRAMPAASPAELSDAQLQAFGDAVGEARVVALAEQTHGGRQEFELRTRLLRYLHERKGFDVLVLESGVFDMALLQQQLQHGGKLDELAQGNVFYMYANSDAGRDLLRYVDSRQAGSRPLALAGMDSQLSGLLSQRELLPRLRRLLNDGDWPVFERHAQRLMQMDRSPPPATEMKRFEAMAVRLQQKTCGPGGDELLCRSLSGLQAQAAGFWRNDYQRDQAMADNVLWLLQRVYPGRKLVLWAHIIHLARGVKLDDRQRFAGDILGQRLGRDYYVLNLTALQGSYLEFASGEVHKIAPAHPGSLEQVMAEQPGELAFLNAPQRLKHGLPARSTQFGYDLPLGTGTGLGSQWDGVFFIRTMAPVLMQR
ncbi:erythromycin esterase family protein [Paucibacter sp. XJ19-41]|uniref:erythromycin esterase family protein n=1 Tax=Paucibacter sp. XJ19-41 TaxID=2927824 RepID=UPI00234B39F3|nr:erythromycin esterase family protein [Paucibacter sp. XJ19-41]MDC6167451.1 erythromycin esterase family protein [Paucibacter sp. XJ19-41]